MYATGRWNKDENRSMPRRPAAGDRGGWPAPLRRPARDSIERAGSSVPNRVHISHRKRTALDSGIGRGLPLSHHDGLEQTATIKVYRHAGLEPCQTAVGLPAAQTGVE